MKIFPVVIVFLGFYNLAAMHLIEIRDYKTPAAAVKYLKNTTLFCSDPAMVGTVAIKLHERFYDEGMTEAEAVAWIDTPQADAWFYEYLNDQGQRRHSWQWIKKQGAKILKTKKRQIQEKPFEQDSATREAAAQFKILFSSYQRGPQIMRAKMETLIGCLAGNYSSVDEMYAAAYLNMPGSISHIWDLRRVDDYYFLGQPQAALKVFNAKNNRSAIAALERAGVERAQ